jgi:uncharacterized protein YbjT (DUF2867 family)
MSFMTTLITAVQPRKAPGAVPTGPVGRQLAKRLLAVGEQVRILAPAPEHTGWPTGVQVLDGDITRPPETSHVFNGVDRLFLAGAAPDTVIDVVDRAIAGGVRCVVVLSSHGPEFEITLPPKQWHWLAIERAVEASPARWTHLRPSAVNASMLPEGCPYPGASWAELIRTRQTIRQPHGAAAIPHLDEDDLAAVAAAALFDASYASTIVEIAGPPISARGRVEVISQAIRQKIQFEELRPNQARELWRQQGWREDTIDIALWAQAHVAAHPVEFDPSIERILGRPPHSFAQWVRNHATAFRPRCE